MRKVILLTTVLFAVAATTTADAARKGRTAAPKAPPTVVERNVNTSKLLSDMVSQTLVPAKSMMRTATPAPAKKATKRSAKRSVKKKR